MLSPPESFCRKIGTVSQFNVSLVAWGKTTRQQVLNKKGTEADSNRGLSAYQSSALAPLGQTSSQLFPGAERKVWFCSNIFNANVLIMFVRIYIKLV